MEEWQLLSLSVTVKIDASSQASVWMMQLLSVFLGWTKQRMRRTSALAGWTLGSGRWLLPRSHSNKLSPMIAQLLPLVPAIVLKPPSNPISACLRHRRVTRWCSAATCCCCKVVRLCLLPCLVVADACRWRVTRHFMLADICLSQICKTRKKQKKRKRRKRGGRVFSPSQIIPTQIQKWRKKMDAWCSPLQREKCPFC